MNYSLKKYTLPIQLQKEEKILTLNFIDINFSEEIVFITNQGNIYRFHLKSEVQELIFNCRDLLDLESGIKIYSYKNYVAFVNTISTKGFMFNLLDNSLHLSLERGDYHVEHCSFPIAFYSRKDEVFLIHGTDWNRLDITSLSDKKLMTDRIVAYHKENPVNYFDYFHSLLCISPDEKHFISNGWVWSPYDLLMMWQIEDFLTEYELKYQNLSDLDTSGYNWDRPLCWIDEKTIAYGYNALESGEDDLSEDTPTEIIIQNIHNNEILERIAFEGFYLNDYKEVKGTLIFDQNKAIFIAFSFEKGITIIDKKGSLVYKNEHIFPDIYAGAYASFLSTDGIQTNLFQLT